MKKHLFLASAFLTLLISCTPSSKAKELYNQACTFLQTADPVALMESSQEKETAIKKLDEAISISPKWWLPYREKIQILKIGSCEENAEQVKGVYNLWIKNGNTLDGFSKFSYACSLYCSDNKAQSLEIFNELYSRYSQKHATDEEKIMFLFSGIVVGEISENNLSSTALDNFDETMVPRVEDFFSYFMYSEKEALWAYV